jgi:hypothetical protein
MSFNTYGLDQVAHKLVLQALKRDQHANNNDSPCLREAYKMREAVAYGLERFWGEHLRHQGKEQKKSDYWKATWTALVNIMSDSGITLPNGSNPEVVAEQLWGDRQLDEQGTMLTPDDRSLSLAVLTQLCDCMVWWTQRYKGDASE